MDGAGQILGTLGICGNLTREGSVNLSDKVRHDYCSLIPEASCDRACGNGNPGSL